MLFHQKTEYFNISSFSLSMVDESLPVDEIMLFIKKAEECEKQSKIPEALKHYNSALEFQSWFIS